MFGSKISLGSLAGVIAAVAIMAVVSSAPAQHPAPDTEAATAAAPPDAQEALRPKVRTGKERLGPKWTDEQRVDNCKVPVDKRGTTPRPDACPGGSD
jgi:hypothetical protein